MGLENDGKVWTWEETLLAFDLYSKTEYSKISARNTEIIELAELLKRKPGAVAKKMFNIAAHDPKQIERGVVALSHSNKFDKLVWEAFEEDTYKFVCDSKKAIADIKNISVDMVINTEIENLELDIFPYGQDRERATTARIGQYFFRTSVLTAYHRKCCITGISEPRLLIASHIKPWKVSNEKTERTNPRNGLCLNSLHDKAFDQGFITIRPDFEIVISNKLKKAEMDQDTKEWLYSYEHKKIILPDKFLPSKEFLEYHNDVIFMG